MRYSPYFCHVFRHAILVFSDIKIMNKTFIQLRFTLRSKRRLCYSLVWLIIHKLYIYSYETFCSKLFYVICCITRFYICILNTQLLHNGKPCSFYGNTKNKKSIERLYSKPISTKVFFVLSRAAHTICIVCSCVYVEYYFFTINIFLLLFKHNHIAHPFHVSSFSSFDFKKY